MSFFVTLEVITTPERVHDAPDVIGRVLAQTRDFDGCLDVKVYRDQAEATHWLITEEWRDVESDAKYRAWRAGDGKSELGTILAAPPSLARWDLTGV